MNTIQKTFILASIILMGNASAEALKDPRTRDVDVSETKVSVKVNTLPNGFFEYVYAVEGSVNNKAEIFAFAIDVSCDKTYSLVTFDTPSDPTFNREYSTGGYVPMQAYEKYGEAVAPAITVRNRVLWMTSIAPGESASGHRIISPNKPGIRTYELHPYVDSTDMSWDYETYPIERDDVPWMSDFIVSGGVFGPSCAEEYYGGSDSWGREPRDVNQLLSYEKPMTNQFHLSSAESGFGMIVHYTYNIDPKSFKVEPGYLRKYFDPVPGTSQEIFLDIKRGVVKNKAGKGKIQLSVRATHSNKGKDKVTLDKMKDWDIFYLHFDK